MVMGGASSSMLGSPLRMSSAIRTSRSASSFFRRPSRTKCSWMRRTSGSPSAPKQSSSGPLAGSGTSSRTRPLVVSCQDVSRGKKRKSLRRGPGARPRRDGAPAHLEHGLDLASDGEQHTQLSWQGAASGRSYAPPPPHLDFARSRRTRLAKKREQGKKDKPQPPRHLCHFLYTHAK